MLPGAFSKVVKNLILKVEGGYMYSPSIRKIYEVKHGIIIGYGSYGGCFSTANIPSGVCFGNYCSIAKNIRIFRANHPKDTFTSHPLLYNPVAGYVKKDMLDRPKLTIGHDVWIGELAIILPGVRSIGNGAIIGAGSIVTKDVPPYSIVVGNPAKKIGEKFNDQTIQQLEASKWWELEVDDLIKEIIRLNNMTKSEVI